MTQPLITREAIRTTWNDCCFNKVEIEEVPEGGCTALQLLDSKMQYRDSLRVVLRPEFLPKSELRRLGIKWALEGVEFVNIHIPEVSKAFDCACRTHPAVSEQDMADAERDLDLLNERMTFSSIGARGKTMAEALVVRACTYALKNRTWSVLFELDKAKTFLDPAALFTHEAEMNAGQPGGRKFGL